MTGLAGGRRHGRKVPELQMTPMIDIVFNLVIFFLLMPSFQAVEGYLPTNLPGEGRGPCRTLLPGYRISLEADGEEGGVMIWLNGTRMDDFRELRVQLDAAAQRLGDEQRLEVPVVISPTTGTWHKHVVAAFDAAIAAGLPSIAFTMPK
jgi:biopolymer transport protein ExbD